MNERKLDQPTNNANFDFFLLAETQLFRFSGTFMLFEFEKQ